jgi:hypothetical protein
MIFVVSSNATSTSASGLEAAIWLTSGVVLRVGGVEDEVGDGGALLLQRRLDLLGETLAVEVLARHDGDVAEAVLDREVGEHLALQPVRRSGPEVEAVVVVGVEARRGVGRREVDDTCAGDLVDDAHRHTGGRGADDGVGVLVEQLVDLGTRDVRGAVARVGLDVHDVLSEDATRGVHVLDREVDSRELGRAEERQVAGLRQQGAEGQRAVALGRGAGLLLAGVGVRGFVVAATTTGGEDERGRSKRRTKAARTGQADHGASGLTSHLRTAPSGTCAETILTDPRNETTSGQRTRSCPICDQIVG